MNDTSITHLYGNSLLTTPIWIFSHFLIIKCDFSDIFILSTVFLGFILTIICLLIMLKCTDKESSFINEWIYLEYIQTVFSIIFSIYCLFLNQLLFALSFFIFFMANFCISYQDTKKYLK